MVHPDNLVLGALASLCHFAIFNIKGSVPRKRDHFVFDSDFVFDIDDVFDSDDVFID